MQESGISGHSPIRIYFTKASLFIILLLLPAIFCFPEGTVKHEHIELILKQDEAVYKLVNSLFLFETDFTGIRLGNNFPLLGGSRIGPYQCRVSLKNGLLKDEKYLLIINTKTIFLDKNRRELSDAIFDACYIKEKFLNIEIRGVQ